MTTIYGTPTSPFVRKVLFALERKQLPYELVPLNPRDLPQDYSEINPAMKIPAYKDAEVTLADSSIICEYLEDRYPDIRIYPINAIEKARCRWFEEYADTTMFDHTTPLVNEKGVKGVILKQPIDEALVETVIEEKIPPIIDYLETELKGREYLAADQLTIADVAVSGIFVNTGLVGYEIDGYRWPSVWSHFQRVNEEPEVAKLITMMREAATVMTA